MSGLSTTYTCGSCKHPLEIEFTDTWAVTCTYCGNLNLPDRKEFHAPSSVASRLYKTPIKLNDECTYEDIKYRVIGYSVYCEKNNTKAVWYEFLLRDDKGNYKIISDFEGHINLFNYNPIDEKELDFTKKGKIVLDIKYKGQTYLPMYIYKTRWLKSEGEFPYDPSTELNLTEFVCGPKIITRSTLNGAKEYTLGEFQTRKESKKAFNKTFQTPSMITTNRVPWKDMSAKLMWQAWLAFVALFIALNYLNFYIQPEEIIWSGAVEISPSIAADSVIETRPFTIKEDNTLLELEMLTPNLKNAWLENSFLLVNITTNQVYQFNLYSSYYEGYDEGSRWTENESIASAYLNSMPAGNYRLMFQRSSSDKQLSTTMQLNMITNPKSWKNFWIFSLIAAFFPLCISIVEFYYKSERYENSNCTFN